MNDTVEPRLISLAQSRAWALKHSARERGLSEERTLDDRVTNTAEMKFSSPDRHFGSLPADKAADVLAAAADVTLVISPSGEVVDAAFGTASLYEAGGRSWVNQKLTDIVTSECGDKVASIMKEAESEEAIRSREINHLMPGGEDVPVRYTAARIVENGHVILFGRDISRIASLQQKLMNSQLSIEREFSRLRAAESRYRTLFQLSDLPLIVLDAATLRVTDINQAACRAIGKGQVRCEGAKVLTLFDTLDTEVLHKMLLAAVEENHRDPVEISLRSGDVIAIEVSTFREDRKNYLLMHLGEQAERSDAPNTLTRRTFLEMVDTMSDALVIADANRQIVSVNGAFVDLFNLSSERAAEGQLIDNWFERPNVDCNVLLANVREHGTVKRFATVMRGTYGQTENVEIAACIIRKEGEPLFGFSIRPMSSSIMLTDADATTSGRSDEQITNLVGHMPLKDIVRETTDLIEKLCIDTALELTRGNRASAAQMLGLSRQSLYAKLDKGKSDDT